MDAVSCSETAGRRARPRVDDKDPADKHSVGLRGSRARKSRLAGGLREIKRDVLVSVSQKMVRAGGVTVGDAADFEIEQLSASTDPG